MELLAGIGLVAFTYVVAYSFLRLMDCGGEAWLDKKCDQWFGDKE